MSLVLNTNIDSLVAQGNLTASGSQLSNALQQLSSGLRVSNAADDSAGYAIAQGMTSQIGGLNQASLNANDGVSLVQTAAGALQEVTNDLQTMRDLAVESLNASNSAQDRQDLNTQFQQLMADINNVAANTQFNGVNLLNGGFQGQVFQVGANVGQTVEVSQISSASSTAIGNYYTTSAGAAAYTQSGVTNGDTVSLTLTITPPATTSNPTPTPVAVTTGNIQLTGNQSTDLAAEAAAINQALGADYGVVATVSGSGISLSSSDASTQTVGVAVNDLKNSINASSTVAEQAGDLGIGTSYTLGNTGGNVASTLSELDVTTVDNANLTLISIDNALQQMATAGANLGAYQNRFQAAITGLNMDATNLSSAKSGIVDADYAQETSALSKAQILQQAGTAMVAQANTIPQNILTLLQKLPS